MKQIEKIGEQSFRLPEHGRIRLGVRGGRYPKAIDKFRFTSVDREAIEQIAERYGGTPSQWDEPSANQRHQWQVIITDDEVDVWLPSDCISTSYEMWSGGGVQRRCDGETCSVVVGSPEGPQEQLVPCMCWEQQQMACKPKTRLNVVLPNIRMGGTWRLETGSWDAFREMPGMVELLHQLQSQGMVAAKLGMTERKRVVPDDKGRSVTRRWKVPQLRIGASPMEILSGQGNTLALTEGEVREMTEMAALMPSSPDDEVVDAEIVEEEPEGWDNRDEIPPEVLARGVVRNRGTGPRWIPKT